MRRSAPRRWDTRLTARCTRRFWPLKRLASGWNECWAASRTGAGSTGFFPSNGREAPAAARRWRARCWRAWNWRATASSRFARWPPSSRSTFATGSHQPQRPYHERSSPPGRPDRNGNGSGSGNGDTETPAEALGVNPEHLRMTEALLFAAAEPLDAKALATSLPDGANVSELVAELQRSY